jgi:hypothetical protein
MIMNPKSTPPTERWLTLYKRLVAIFSKYGEEDIETAEDFWVYTEMRSEAEQRVRVGNFEFISSELISDLQAVLTSDFPESKVSVRSLEPKQSICVLEITKDKAELQCY